MLDNASQRELAKEIHPLLEARGIPVVFVGSTAIVGLDLFPRTSKDADALGPPELTMTDARRILEEVATAEGLQVQERGWGTVSLVKIGQRGEAVWTVDLLVPEGGPIPQAAASLIHEHATETEIGPTAIAEHILATKAVAYGDCLGKGDRESADRYESDLLQLDRVLPEGISWDVVRDLLSAFPSSRRRTAAGKIREIFGEDLGFTDEPDPSVA